MKIPQLPALLCSILLQTTLIGAGIFTTASHQILLDGSPFEVRGMNYQPAAIGENPSAAYPFGDYYWISSDYEARWARDIENFRKMGINVIRIYGWDPNQNHDAFLQLLEDNGMYLLVNRYVNPNSNWADSAVVEALEQEWIDIATPLANHPSIMGFLIGNEVNVHGNSSYGGTQNRNITDFWTAMNAVAAEVKAVAPNKLVSVAITDDMPSVSVFDPDMTAFDFWGMQIYRGETFGTLFTEFDAASDKPLVITEFGHDAYNSSTGAEFADNAAYPADIVEIQWNEMRANSDISPGGCVFEYADEWWKSSGSDFDHDTGGWANSGYIDGLVSEEWWGVFRTVDNGSSIDLLEPRAMFYRLAAMWNEPFEIVAIPGPGTTGLQVDFSYPEYLRDQHLLVEASTDLTTWTPVADNDGSPYLMSTHPAIAVTNNPVGDSIEVAVLQDASHSPPEPEPEPDNLLANGNFETGDTSGWTGPGAASSAFQQEGAYAFELVSVTGGFSVPATRQEFPASEGDVFDLSGYMYTPAPLPSDATFGLLKIVFADAGGTALPPAAVSQGQFGPGNAPGAESLPFLDSSSPAGQWIFTEARATAPPGTESVSFYLIHVDESPSNMYFDAINALDVSPGTGSSSLTGDKIFLRFENLGR